jgi:hypothetical protein
LLESVPTPPASITQVTALLNEPVPETTPCKTLESPSCNATCDALILMPVMLEPSVFGLMLSVTVPDLLGSWTLVARTIVVLALTRLGAVKPTLGPVAAESVPPPLTMFQVTAGLNPFCPVTDAVKVARPAALIGLTPEVTVTV